jgi:hypothetical protein
LSKQTFGSCERPNVRDFLFAEANTSKIRHGWKKLFQNLYIWIINIRDKFFPKIRQKPVKNWKKFLEMERGEKKI